MKRFLRTHVGASVCLLALCFLFRSPANAQCSGQTSTTSLGANAGVGGTTPWQNPNSVNSSYTSVDALLSVLSIITTTTDYLNVTNLGLSVPSGNTICGVVVTVNRQNFSLLSLGSSTVKDRSIMLIKNGARVGTDQAATSTSWPTTAATASYGSSGDLWGTTLTPADVNASNFGVAISAKLVAQILSVAFTAQIDEVKVTVYSSGPILLPINVQDFTAHSATGGNVLAWTASADEIAGRWAVERSGDGSNWQQLDVLTATTGQHDYQYTDASPLSGSNFYRLCQLSADGNFTYSAVRSVTGASFKSIHCYPNPFKDMINVTSPRSFTKLSLSDLQGRVLFVKDYGRGVSNAQLPAVNLPPGTYFVQVDGATYKLIKN